MKYREDFVTNSSSSSYLCEVCGHIESGYDLDITEAEYRYCEAGHVYCFEHELGRDRAKIFLAKMKRLVEEGRCEEEELDRVELMSVGDFHDYIEEMVHEFDLDYEYPKEACPICQMTTIEDRAIITYLLKEVGKNRQEIDQALRDKFKNYEDMARRLWRNDGSTTS